MKEGDRVHFFQTNLPDGNVINGGTNIIGLSREVSKPSEEWYSTDPDYYLNKAIEAENK